MINVNITLGDNSADNRTVNKIYGTVSRLRLQKVHLGEDVNN